MLSAVKSNPTILKDDCFAAIGYNRFEDPQINAVEYVAATPGLKMLQWCHNRDRRIS